MWKYTWIHTHTLGAVPNLWKLCVTSFHFRVQQHSWEQRDTNSRSHTNTHSANQHLHLKWQNSHDWRTRGKMWTWSCCRWRSLPQGWGSSEGTWSFHRNTDCEEQEMTEPRLIIIREQHMLLQWFLFPKPRHSENSLRPTQTNVETELYAKARCYNSMANSHVLVLPFIHLLFLSSCLVLEISAAEMSVFSHCNGTRCHFSKH